MPQPVLRPARKTGRVAHTPEFAACPHRNDMPFNRCVRSQPRCEVTLNRNDSPAGGFGLGGFNFDMGTSKVDFAPVQSLNFRLAQPSECAYG